MRLVYGEDFEVDNGLMHYFLVDLVYGNVKRENFPYSQEINEKIGKNIEIKEDLEIPNLISLDYDIYSKAFCDKGPVSDRMDIVIQGKSSCYPACVLFKPLFKKKSLFKKKFDVIFICLPP